MKSELFVGVDVGSSRTKVAVLNSAGELAGYSIKKSGTDFGLTSEDCLKEALKEAGKSGKAAFRCVSTGYGRKNVPFRHDTKTEIGCHAKGCYHYFPMAMTIIDIGGQDNKIIKVDGDGHPC
ncbi:BadF/BadG/BcrA/BcrD ATPase family protein [Thermodesulfobacteriota bacterium]